jgi:fatty acid CoA ligase FadD36
MALLSALASGPDDRPDAVRVGDDIASRERILGAATAVADRIAGAVAVAVDATPTMHTIVAVTGAILAGVPVVPVPADAGPMERDHILCDSGAALLLTEPSRLDREATVPVVPVELAAKSSTAYHEPPGTATCLLLYTSGTTGSPKGVRVSRDAVAADLDALAEAWAWTPADLLVHGLPLYHVHGLVLGVLGPLRLGSRLRHTVRPTPEAYAGAGGSLYFGVPTVWSRIAREPDAARALRGARLLVSGSAALAPAVFDALHELTGQRPVERYGMTETLITVSARAGGPRLAGAVGTPLSGVRTRVHGEDSELQVRGDTLFDGYLNQPGATAECFTSDGWFRTGDCAVIDEDGVHRIVGRLSTDLIKSGGYRIGAGEVEQALLTHPAVREAAVVGAEHADLGQEIVAYVVADGVTAEQLIDFVAASLSVHKRPRRVHLVDDLPRNAMGKIQKRLLTP